MTGLVVGAAAAWIAGLIVAGRVVGRRLRRADRVQESVRLQQVPGPSTCKRTPVQ
jgi:hypothetical protein